MDCAVSAAARQFRDYSSRLSRTLRIQPAWTRKRFHHAKRAGRPGRAITTSGRTSAGALTNGNPVHHIHSTGHRSVEREDRHLAVSGVRSDALRRTFFRLRFFTTRRPTRRMAARSAQRSSWDDEYRDPDPVIGHGRARMGRPEDAPLSRLLVVHARHHSLRHHLSLRKTLLRMAAEV